MKNMVKKNQIMITALAIMIAVAGYLNFAGSKITEEEIMTAGSGTVMSEDVADSDVAALFEISDEDMEQADIILPRSPRVRFSSSLALLLFHHFSHSFGSTSPAATRRNICFISS